MLYNITQNFLTQNRSHAVLKPIGIVVHETASPNASDDNEFTYFNGGYRGASAHGFVDFDSITQTIPWTEQAWHAGPYANRNFIGIELCHYDDSRFNEVWNRAVWLFTYLFINVLKINTVNKDNLMSHAEVSNKWHETNHQDPISYFAQFGKTVDDFRVAVQQEINNQINSIKEVKKVKNIVVYGNSIDKRAAEYLADFLNCPTLDGSIPYDYSQIENVYCIGSEPTTNGKVGWTGYATKIISVGDRFDTCRAVLDFIKNGGK